MSILRLRVTASSCWYTGYGSNPDWFARIHKANLINFGIIPFEFQNPSEFELLTQGTSITIENVVSSLKRGNNIMESMADKNKVMLKVDLTTRQREVLIDGGLLNYIRSGSQRS